MTRLQMRVLVQQLLGNRSDGLLTSTWYDDRVVAGYRRLVTFQGHVPGSGRLGPRYRRLRFPSLEDRVTRSLTTALTSNFVALQSGSLAIFDIYDRTNNRGLNFVSLRQLRNRDPDEGGVPREWHQAGEGGVEGYNIWPRPTLAAHNIDVYEYVLRTPVLATDGASPEIPESWHMGIVYAGASEGAALLKDIDESTRLYQAMLVLISQQLSPGELSGSLSGRAGARRYQRIGSGS